jgi:hypothetical protein
LVDKFAKSVKELRRRGVHNAGSNGDNYVVAAVFVVPIYIDPLETGSLKSVIFKYPENPVPLGPK